MATQHLAIDQHAIAVENDEIGLGHRTFVSMLKFSFIRIYAHHMSNNPKNEPRGLTKG
jgi:hypothetical protein